MGGEKGVPKVVVEEVKRDRFNKNPVPGLGPHQVHIHGLGNDDVARHHSLVVERAGRQWSSAYPEPVV